MDIKQTLLRVFLFNRWLCRSESAKKTSKGISRLKRYIAISITFAEFINFLFICGFSSVIIYSKLAEDIAMRLPSYALFAEVSVFYFMAFFMLGVAQLVSALIPSLRATKASGLCGIASSFVWGVVGGAFFASQGQVLTTASMMYGIWAGAMFFTGNKLISRALKKETVIKGA